MSIQYAGGTIVHTTFTDDGSRGDLVSKLNTALKDAGWSAVSGDGTGDVLMKSAVHEDGQNIHLRLLDPGSGNSAQFFLRNASGSLVSQTFWLAPASAEWRVIANRYSLYMFRTGAANRTLARGVLMGGTIWVPSFVHSLMASDKEIGWLHGTGTSDTDASGRNSWRSWIVEPARASSLYTSFMVNYGGFGDHTAPMFKNASLNRTASGTFAEAWQGGETLLIEPIISWSSSTGSTSRSAYKGVLFDALVSSLRVDGETTISFDGHTWMAITDNCTYASQGVSTLYVAVD